MILRNSGRFCGRDSGTAIVLNATIDRAGQGLSNEPSFALLRLIMVVI